MSQPTRRFRPHLTRLEDRLAPAALDPNFGTQGKVLADVFGADDRIALAQDASERLVVAVSPASQGGGPHPFQVARFTTTGVLDPLFGTGGRVTTDGFDPRPEIPVNAFAQGVAALGNRVVAAGNANNAEDLAVVRYSEGGTVEVQRILDRGEDEGYYRVSDMATDANGRVLIAGRFFHGETGLFHAFVLRLQSDLTPDGFGTGGWFAYPLGDWQSFGGERGAPTLAVMPDGKVVVALTTLDGGSGNPVLTVLRLTAGGVLDAGFADQGVFTDDFGSADNSVVGMDVLADGDKAVVVGDLTDPTDPDGENYPALWRVLPDGGLDPTFDADGRVRIDLGSTWEPGPGWRRSGARTPDGEVLVFDQAGGFRTFRVGPDGSRDTTFEVHSDFGPALIYRPAGIVYQPTRDAFVVAGDVRYWAGDNTTDLALARYFVGNHVSLTAPSHYASIGEGAQLTARVYRDGDPWAGQSVQFEGTVDGAVVFTATATTDDQGFATVTHVMADRAEVVYTASSGGVSSLFWSAFHVPADERLKVTLTSLDGADDDDKPDVLFPALFALFGPELAVLKATVTYDDRPLAGATVNLTSTAFARYDRGSGGVDPIGPPVAQVVDPTGQDGVTYFQYSSMTSHTDEFVATAVHAGVTSKAAPKRTIHWRQVEPDLDLSYVYGFDTATVRARLVGTLKEYNLGRDWNGNGRLDSTVDYEEADDADNDGTSDEYQTFPFRDVMVEFHVSGTSAGNGEDRPTPGSRPNNWQLTDANGIATFTYPVGTPTPESHVDVVSVDPKSGPFADLRLRLLAGENGADPDKVFRISISHFSSLNISPARATPTIGTEVTLPVWHGDMLPEFEVSHFPTDFNVVYTVTEGPNAAGGPRTIDPPGQGHLTLASSVPGTDKVFAQVFDNNGQHRGTTGTAEIEWRLQNTPTGTQVEVRPPVAGLGLAPFTLIFDGVSAAGETSIELTAVGHNFSGDFPGYGVYDLNGFLQAAFEIHTTATYSGPVRIRFDVPVSDVYPNTFKLVHFDGTRSEQVGSEDNDLDRLIEIEGTVNSLSPFAILVPDLPARRGSGNVTVKVARRKLIVTGDDADNLIRIEAGDAGPESFRVIGVGTTVNGQALAQQFTGVRNGLVVRTGKGDDEILLDGSARGMQLKGVSIDSGQGDDTVRTIGVAVAGGFTAVTGLGADVLEVVGSQFDRAVGLNTGAGDDYINIERATFAHSLSVNGGRNDDYMAFRESVFGTVPKPGPFRVRGSHGLDVLDAGFLVTPNGRGNLNPERLRRLSIDELVT